jgi:hypothetical protein
LPEKGVDSAWGRLTLQVFLLVLLVAAGQSCRPLIPYYPGIPQEDQTRTLALRNLVAHLYPRSFGAVHRGILEAGGRNYVFDGYLLVNEPDSFRLTVKADMGGTVFELAKSPGRETVVAKNSLGLRRAWLEEGAARDVVVLYLRRPEPTAQLVRHESGRWGLVQESPEGTREEFLFDADGSRLESYVRSWRARVLYRADFVYGEFPRWPRPIPKNIAIADNLLNYTLKITVSEMVEVVSPGKGQQP